MLREMTVSGLTIDPFTNSPIMILKDVDSDKAVPIWIGLLEATAIASELENIKFSRPMTHDLLKNIMELMETTVTKVEVCDLRDNTYFALIYIIREGQEVSIDARPSDAIDVKAERLARLQALQNELTRKAHARLVGQIHEVLVEGRSKRSPQEWCGRLRTNQVVNFIGPRELLGPAAWVAITEALPHSLKGRWV